MPDLETGVDPGSCMKGGTGGPSVLYVSSPHNPQANFAQHTLDIFLGPIFASVFYYPIPSLKKIHATKEKE